MENYLNLFEIPSNVIHIFFKLLSVKLILIFMASRKVNNTYKYMVYMYVYIRIIIDNTIKFGPKLSIPIVCQTFTESFGEAFHKEFN